MKMNGFLLLSRFKKIRKNVLTTQESNTPRVCNFKVRVQEAVLFESWQ
jgi:hypothetical protein